MPHAVTAAGGRVSPGRRGLRRPAWNVLSGLVLLLVAAALHGLQAPQVRVQWADGLTADARAALERRFSLREHSHDGTSSYLYDLLNPSRTVIRDLVGAPEARDTDGIVRGVFELREPRRYGDRRTGLAWRWGVERWVPLLAAAAVLLLFGRIVSGVFTTLWRLSVRASRWTRMAGAKWLPAGIPAMDARAFGWFRVVFAGMLGLFLWVEWRGAVPLDQQRALHIPVMNWIRPWAAEPSVVSGLQWVMLTGLMLFAAGLWSRLMFAVVVAGFELWCFVFALRTGAHPLGLLPLVLPILLLVPWHEGRGLGRRGAACAPESGVPYGFAPWALGLALSIAFFAAAYSKGVTWALNGTVRYHFMVDGEIALLPWGLWIAAHPALSVVVSTFVVVAEHAVILGMFWPPLWRAGMGLVVVGLITGFSVFHHAIWPAWWVMLLGFVPWEWFNTAPASHDAAPVRVRRLPAAAAVAVLLLAAQQVVVSVARIEVAPYFSAYDMYSTTFTSPEEFERANGAPRLLVLASVRSGERDISDCLGADAPVQQELETAARAGTAPRTPVTRQHIVDCAATFRATRVRVLAEQRTYDWEHGRTGYRFRDRLVAEWPVP